MFRPASNKRLLIFIGITVTVFIAAAFVPATERDYIVIQAPLNNILPAVQELRYWKKWHPDLITDTAGITLKGTRLGTKSVDIEAVSTTPFGILVKQTVSGQQSIYALIVQGSDNTTVSKVEIRFGTTLLKLLWDEAMNLLPIGPNRILLALRTYLEDSKAYYGYQLSYTKVTDTLVITSTSEAETSVIKDSLQALFLRLRTFTETHKIPVTDSPMAYIQRTEQPVKKLMVGLPVTKEINTPANIEYQRMPEGRMLTVDFTGNYRNIQEAYRAADRYINDYTLKTVALPFERYYSIHDSANAHVRIFFPIF